MIRRLLIWALDVWSPSCAAMGLPAFHSFRSALFNLPRDRRYPRGAVPTRGSK